MGGSVPKQYQAIAGTPVLRLSVQAFLRHPAIDGVRVVIHPDDRRLYDQAVTGLDLLEPVDGGDTRQESVRRGLESLAAIEPEFVMIHDAARPFVSADSIAAVRRALDTTPGAITAIPVVDSLKRVADGRIASSVHREGLWRAQTPQAFRYSDIRVAHQRLAGSDMSDDAAIAERAGMALAVISGEESNFKITSDADLERARGPAPGAVLAPRTGLGFDVHGFGPGDHLWLCGVRIPFGRGLVGHSDADVGLHALTDAVLGAIAAGDIGMHFSDQEPRWRGAASALFLEHAAGLTRTRGGRILHLDLTIICEQPRIGPHREAMVARVAEIAGLSAARVSIKATTTEKLGFTGRGEGIAAQAAATVLLPEAD